jgi:hypothetical protein
LISRLRSIQSLCKLKSDKRYSSSAFPQSSCVDESGQTKRVKYRAEIKSKVALLLQNLRNAGTTKLQKRTFGGSMVEKTLSGYPPCEQNPMVSQQRHMGKRRHVRHGTYPLNPTPAVQWPFCTLPCFFRHTVRPRLISVKSSCCLNIWLNATCPGGRAWKQKVKTAQSMSILRVEDAKVYLVPVLWRNELACPLSGASFLVSF